jgi:NADH:ubiquinone oxidoreductase subunit 3 (subunit A)
METLILYGLVGLFFVLLVVFTIAVLSGQPYVAPQSPAARQENAVEAGSTDSRGAYGAVAILFLLLLVLTFVGQRRQAHAGAS